MVVFIQQGFGHYVENIGREPLKFFALFNSPTFEEISISKWLAGNPASLIADNFNIYGYTVGATLAQALKQCGNELTHENVMRQSANLKDLRLETLLPGIVISTAPSDYAPIEAVQLQRFNGKQWELFGDVMTSQ